MAKELVLLRWGPYDGMNIEVEEDVNEILFGVIVEGEECNTVPLYKRQKSSWRYFAYCGSRRLVRVDTHYVIEIR